MPDASVASLFRRMAQGVHHYLAESLRICSVYLGIAVIVTVSMGFALLVCATGIAGAQSLVDRPRAYIHASGFRVRYRIRTQHRFVLGHRDGRARPPATPPACSGRPARRQKPAMVATGPQAEALRNYISRKYKVAYDATGPLVGTVYHKQLDPLLLL